MTETTNSVSYNFAQLAADHNLTVNHVRARYIHLLRSRWKADFRMFCKHRVKIRNKAGEKVPLELNSAQEIMFSRINAQLAKSFWVRMLILKGRRQGASTFIDAFGYWLSDLWEGYNVYVQAHVADSSEKIYGIVKYIYDNDKYHQATLS